MACTASSRPDGQKLCEKLHNPLMAASLLGTGTKLDVACLNAGLARATGATDVSRTKDGFELTVGTNHLGHFYLNSLLLPQLQSNGRIVVTASSVHDPDSPGGAQGKLATLGNLDGFERDGKYFEMVDGGRFNADKAYKDSKVRHSWTKVIVSVWCWVAHIHFLDENLQSCVTSSS